MMGIISTIHKIDPRKTKMESNIEEEEENALRELKSLTQESIEVKKADKSNILVIMDKEEYKEKLVLKQHLETNTYEKAENDTNKKVYNRMQELTNKYEAQLTKQEKKAILDKDLHNSHFYTLPKISKCKEIIDQMELHSYEDAGHPKKSPNKWWNKTGYTRSQ